MNIIKYPSRIVLFGEHSVLKGGTAISISIQLYGTMSYTKSDQRGIYIYDKNRSMIDMSHIFEIYDKVDIVLDTKIGCGLGSSAIISLLLSHYVISNKCMFDLNNLNLPISNINIFEECGQSLEILKLAHRFENLFHRVSSGVDVMTSHMGGLISYKEGYCTRLPTEFLKHFKIMIWDSGLEKSPLDVLVMTKINDNIFDGMRAVAAKAESVLSRPFELQELYVLFRENQFFLEELEIVPTLMRKEVDKLRKMKIECKITGAGFGGYLVTVVNRDVVLDDWVQVYVHENE